MGSRDREQHSRTRIADHELLLDNVLETMAGGVFTVDPTGEITTWNRAMQEITGYSADEALGQTCSLIDGGTCFRGPASQTSSPCALFAEGIVHRRRCTLRRRDGSTVTVLKHARLMRDAQGKVVGGIESVNDVSGMMALREELQRLRQEAFLTPVRALIGRHPAMRRVYDMIEVAARGTASVLIMGETGTGKELVAQAIHEASDRADGPYVRVSFVALADTLLESELFGHVRGAFTGAVRARQGRFEAAAGGTILLDEIGAINASVQKTLLRVLQEHVLERVGDQRSIPVDFRVIAATNVDLQELVRAGAFRDDLFYRLAVIPITVPPLRDRKSDIPLLVEHRIDRLNRAEGMTINGVSPEALRVLMAHSWPGNVRELFHAIEYAAAVTQGGVIKAEELPETVRRRPRNGGPTSPPAARRSRRPDRATLAAMLEDEGYNRTRTAKRLGVSRVTLWKWMKQLGLSASEG